MTPENNHIKNVHYSLKGLNGLAECELKFIKNAESKKKEGYIAKVSRLVIDLERIKEDAERFSTGLDTVLIRKINEQISKHPDRKEIVMSDFKSIT